MSNLCEKTTCDGLGQPILIPGGYKFTLCQPCERAAWHDESLDLAYLRHRQATMLLKAAVKHGWKQEIKQQCKERHEAETDLRDEFARWLLREE